MQTVGANIWNKLESQFLDYKVVMKDHFLEKDTRENRVRLVIFTLMGHFEGMHNTIDKLLNFELHEEKAKDLVEAHLIDMEKLHLNMMKEIRDIERENDLPKQIDFEETRLFEAIRRTNNFLKMLNIIDLDKDNWIAITTKGLIDKTYYRQIKALVYWKI